VEVVKIAKANPLPPPLIRVNSPQNNKIYSSNEVQLNFTQIPNTDINLTSFAYSLDGQAREATNGSSILTGLSYGSHTLAIYGNGTYLIGNNTHEYNSTLAIVYFSTFFSTSWVVVTIVLAAVICTGLLIYFKKRRQLATALKGKKTASFWVGLFVFSFFAALVFFPSVWQMVSDYLFPYYPHYGISGFLGYGVVFGFIFMCIGWYMMRLGAKKVQTQKENKKMEMV
jgi:hypothetical protein